ncbi:hypothetical protein DDZ13_07055 [Coraliomargarita sinensis]|uniref:Glycerophosphoryl diester phosphodiesterase membrane domain-containing protein n=1 Tax=Coraliomargarita sinensis TaxID=2174842 RepID=A0A317ZFL7_9BACT|nr:DUF6159 family protein [Coraliomargarita sinensis]PXA04286.1 hypothetical protein DDZ13_07055 [Coraliomargarita sinensis]
MIFRTWSRSWEFAKLSYSTLFDHKHLMVFPAISTTATILVLMSFLLPLEMTGQLDTWLASIDSEASGSEDPTMYVTAFLFYFCNYFCIVFFNTALIASVMDIFEGGQGRIGFGLKFAMKRIHAIFGWALVSACVGMILNALERNDKIGRIVASLLGSAWTALTYFVIPVIVAEGLGPVAAIKSSMNTLKKEWGTALMGNFSMGTFGFLLMLPVIGIGIVLGLYVSIPVALAICVPLGILAVLFSATADAVFKAYLYSFATGKTLPDNVDTLSMRGAFSQR